MNARDFIRISDINQLQQIDVLPHFSSVMSILNKDNSAPILGVISKFPGNTIQQQLYSAIHSLKEIPRCTCGKKLEFRKISLGYATFCSPKCRETDPSVQVQREQTNLKRYGVKNTGQSEIKKQKIQQTNIARYGVHSTLSLAATRDKTLRALSVNQLEIAQKRASTNTERYGTSCSLWSEDGRSKTLNTLWERYGVAHSSQIPEVRKKKAIHLSSFKRTSLFEELVVSEIKKLGYAGKIERNIRSVISPLEIDIWLPDLKLGIECNGCYWHSDPWKPKDYHQIKTDKIEQMGGKLIHLFDIEWNNKRDQIINRLKSALNLDKKIYGRNCEIRKISTSESREFLKQHHTQGFAVAKIHLGLFNGDTLVSVMTFGKPRFNKKYDWELLRFASSCTVVGAASKLLKFFRKQNSGSIISYADRRWSNGNVYTKMGFTLLSKTSPGYWYFKGTELKHRVVFQKHKLKNLLEVYDEKLGEVENMYSNGWRRVFDSGNLVFALQM